MLLAVEGYDQFLLNGCVAIESICKILKAAPGWGEKAVWEAFRSPALKGNRPAPKDYKLSPEDIELMRKRYGINK